MSKPILRDNDITLAPILERKVAILGYGNQGKPHALNLRDSGVNVKIGARLQSHKKAEALEAGFEVLSFREVAAWADVLMMALPDEVMGEVYQNELAEHLKPGQALGFVHGLAIHAQWIQPNKDVDVFLVAPKAQGRAVRNRFLLGQGVPGLYGVHQNPTGQAEAIALAYAKAIGCGRVGIMPTTFAEETICDLFSEQAVLCGGLTALIKAAFDTLVAHGFSEEVAYFECLYEVKLIADLLHERGINGMREAISSTALYGDLTRGERIIDGHVRETMRLVLQEVMDGRFMQAMKTEFETGKPVMQTALWKDEHHAIEATHRRLKAQLQF